MCIPCIDYSPYGWDCIVAGARRSEAAGPVKTLRVPGSVSLSICITEGWVSGASDSEFWVIVESMDLNRQGCYGGH